MNNAEAVLKALRTVGKTVSAAESITAGHLQSLMASVSGSSDVFVGGITAYQPSIKVELLGVDETLAHETDCVDEAIACQMAQGALKLFNSDYALATCGYAERDDGKPYAFYAIAEATSEILCCGRIELSGNRIEVQRMAAQIVMNKFRTLLGNKPCNE